MSPAPGATPETVSAAFDSASACLASNEDLHGLNVRVTRWAPQPTGRVPLDLSADEFRSIGHALVDDLAAMFESLESPSELPVALDLEPADVRAALGQGGLPETGTPAAELIAEARDLLFAHSTQIGHPRFWGYICGAPAPIGALADLLAAGRQPERRRLAARADGDRDRAADRPLAGRADRLSRPAAAACSSPAATWRTSSASSPARRAKAPWDVRARGHRAASALTASTARPRRTPGSQKAADLFGLGTNAIRWIETDDEQRLDVDDAPRGDRRRSRRGRTTRSSSSARPALSRPARSTRCRELAEICREEGLWFHVDGADGGFAACLPDAPDDLRRSRSPTRSRSTRTSGCTRPLEAGCVLVRDPSSRCCDAFAYRPPYYHFDPRDDAELLRARAAELARVPGAQGLARAAPGGPRRATRR